MIDALEPRHLLSFGQVDTAWASNGRVISTIGEFAGNMADIAVAGGKIYTVADHTVFRYNANGSLDTSYGIAGARQFNADNGPNVVRQVIVAPTGELFVLCTLS